MRKIRRTLLVEQKQFFYYTTVKDRNVTRRFVHFMSPGTVFSLVLIMETLRQVQGFFTNLESIGPQTVNSSSVVDMNRKKGSPVLFLSLSLLKFLNFCLKSNPIVNPSPFVEKAQSNFLRSSGSRF